MIQKILLLSTKGSCSDT